MATKDKLLSRAYQRYLWCTLSDKQEIVLLPIVKSLKLIDNKNNKFLQAYDDIFLSDRGVIVLTLSVMLLYFNAVFPLVLCFLQ